jgi:regulator of replication initiation timing
MSYAKDLIDQLQSLLNTYEADARYMRERIGELRDENKYLTNQIDVLLKVLGKEQHGNQD